MTRDRIDALADELFAAAREEQPERELVVRVERTLAASTLAAAGSGEHPVESGPRGARALPRRPALLLRGLLAASVCAALAALVLPRARDAVLISAERSSEDAASTRAARPRVEGASDPRRAERGREAAANATDRQLASAPTAPEREAAAPSATGPSPSKSSTLSRPPRAAAARPDAAPARTLSHELGALKQIHLALRDGDGSGALALLDRYDTGEYGSSLALEASVLRVEALAAVGRRAEAEVLARRFVRQNPDSPLAERAQRFIDRSERARPADSRP